MKQILEIAVPNGMENGVFQPVKVALSSIELAEVSGGELCEIKPEIPYTRDDLDWMDKKSRSSIEMNDPSSRPGIADWLPDMGKYGVIFVGFPN